MRFPIHLPLLGAACIALGAAPVIAQDSTPDPADRRVYFGEQHIHSSWPPDPYAAGVRQAPGDAYRYAMGQEMPTTIQERAWSSPISYTAPAGG